MLVATVVVELYDETASFGRRLRLTHNCTQALYVFNLSVSLIGGARDRDITTHTDASVSTGRQIRDPYDSTVVLVGTGHLPCDPSASPQTPNFGPGLSDWRSGDPAYESFFVAETVHDVPYEQANSPGWSPANFTRGFRRYGLIGARMTRVLSPQCEQNPIKVSAYCTGGRKKPPPDGQQGSRGAWCFDQEGTEAAKALLAQAAEAGVEMFVFPQNMNGTWRSMVGNEFASAANISWMRAIVDIAHKAGIEVGAYQLLLNARSATALNQAAPSDAASLPNAGYDCMDPTTRLPDHKRGAQCKGGSGCSALCGATEFFSKMEASMHAWWRATGVSTVSQDGAESNTACANESHAHHHGLNDSIWQQYRAVRRTFQTYLTSPMRDREGNLRRASMGGVSASLDGPVPTVGFVSGMPGSVMEAGEAKVPGGYSEMIFGLPRWTWIDRVRESMIASPFGRDGSVSVGQRMFPLPYSAPYHPSMLDPKSPGRWTPFSGYESVGTLCEGSCEDHLTEIEWALSGMWGTGAFPQLRSTILWDGPRSKALLQKWIAWAKKYRRILSSEFVTLRHGTECWGKTLNVSKGGPSEHGGGCSSNGLDAVLHRAPQHFYSDIDERGLAVVWNPTNRTISTTLLAPMYYAGVARARGDVAAMVSVEGGPPTRLPLEAAGDTIPLLVSLAPRALTWFVITAAS